VNHLTSQIAQKRDVRREVPLSEDSGNRGIPDPEDAPPAKATPTAAIINRGKEGSDSGEYLASLPQPRWDAMT
jgi:hypothetical protein